MCLFLSLPSYLSVVCIVFFRVLGFIVPLEKGLGQSTYETYRFPNFPDDFNRSRCKGLQTTCLTLNQGTFLPCFTRLKSCKCFVWDLGHPQLRVFVQFPRLFRMSFLRLSGNKLGRKGFELTGTREKVPSRNLSDI